MSNELFINPLEGSAGITREGLRLIFRGVVVEIERDYWRLEFGSPDNSCHINLGPVAEDEGRINGLTVFRPIGEPLFYAGLFTLLQEGGMFLYWPGSPPLVVMADDVERVPKDVVDVLGPPIYARYAQEIPEHIARHP